MRDRYLGLVLAFLAWIVVPGAAARAAEHGDAGIGVASESTIVVDRGHAPGTDACASTTTWSAAAEVAAIEDVDAPHVVARSSKCLSPARPRGPPSM